MQGSNESREHMIDWLTDFLQPTHWVVSSSISHTLTQPVCQWTAGHQSERQLKEWRKRHKNWITFHFDACWFMSKQCCVIQSECKEDGLCNSLSGWLDCEHCCWQVFRCLTSLLNPLNWTHHQSAQTYDLLLDCITLYSCSHWSGNSCEVVLFFELTTVSDINNVIIALPSCDPCLGPQKCWNNFTMLSHASNKRK